MNASITSGGCVASNGRSRASRASGGSRPTSRPSAAAPPAAAASPAPASRSSPASSGVRHLHPLLALQASHPTLSHRSRNSLAGTRRTSGRSPSRKTHPPDPTAAVTGSWRHAAHARFALSPHSRFDPAATPDRRAAETGPTTPERKLFPGRQRWLEGFGARQATGHGRLFNHRRDRQTVAHPGPRASRVHERKYTAAHDSPLPLCGCARVMWSDIGVTDSGRHYGHPELRKQRMGDHLISDPDAVAGKAASSHAAATARGDEPRARTGTRRPDAPRSPTARAHRASLAPRTDPPNLASRPSTHDPPPVLLQAIA